MFVTVALGLVLGAVAGSAATALQDRYQKLREFFVGRSACPHCHTQLRWFELIPVVSWLVQAGRCRTCGKPIGWPSFAVEVCAAAVGAAVVFECGIAPWLGWLWILTIILGALVLVDLEAQLLPDVLLIAAAPLLLLVGWLAPSVQLSFISAIEGALIGGGLLGFLWLITKGKGMGLGDVKLAALLGLGLGLQLAMVAMMVAFITGGAIASLLILTGRAKFGQRISFGPLLVLGYVVALTAGPMILTWYSG